MVDRGTQHPLPFSFLDLPAEIRNMIYKYSLTAPKGLDMYRVKNNSRGSRTLVRRRPVPPTGDVIALEILRVCKQINTEATQILYSDNIFKFDQSGTLPMFFSHNAIHVRDFRYVTLDIYNIAVPGIQMIFSTLVYAENLERVYLEWSMSDVTGAAEVAARIFYGAARIWLETVGIRKGNKTAAVGMLRMPRPTHKKAIQSSHWPLRPRPDGLSSEDQGKFAEALRKLLA